MAIDFSAIFGSVWPFLAPIVFSVIGRYLPIAGIEGAVKALKSVAQALAALDRNDTGFDDVAARTVIQACDVILSLLSVGQFNGLMDRATAASGGSSEEAVRLFQDAVAEEGRKQGLGTNALNTLRHLAQSFVDYELAQRRLANRN